MTLADLIHIAILLIPALVAWRTGLLWPALLSVALVQLVGAGLTVGLIDRMPWLFQQMGHDGTLSDSYTVASPPSYLITLSLIWAGLCLPTWALERKGALLSRALAWAATWTLLVGQAASWLLPRLILARTTPQNFDDMSAAFDQVTTISAAAGVAMLIAFATLIAVLIWSGLHRRRAH